MKRIFSLMLILSLVFVAAGCGTSGSSSTSSASPSGTASASPTNTPVKKVSIIITNGKGEIASQWQQAAKDFMKAYPNITVDAYSQAVGDTLSPFDKLTASGKTVTIAMFEPSAVMNQYKDFGVDLSNEKWVSDTKDSFKNPQGQIVGFPFAIEGFGLIYNQKVVDKAVGGNFDPFSINTRDKLIALFDKVQASGIKYPVAYQTEAWSVGNHYSSMFLDQAKDPNTIVNQLKAGTFDLMKNADWNGYYDTMDLLASKKYNVFGASPIGKYYDQAHVDVGQGKEAFIFNGDWAYDSFKAVAGDEFGFMPVPVDNNPDNPLNNKIAVGPTQLLVINKKATPDQQEAAKTFLNWLVYSKEGQDFVVNKSQIISPFKNNPNKVTNPLGIAISNAIAAGKTMPFSTNYIIAGDWSTTIGPDVQKYIAKLQTRQQLAAQIETYFKNLKK